MRTRMYQIKIFHCLPAVMGDSGPWETVWGFLGSFVKCWVTPGPAGTVGKESFPSHRQNWELPFLAPSHFQVFHFKKLQGLPQVLSLTNSLDAPISAPWEKEQLECLSPAQGFPHWLPHQPWPWPKQLNQNKGTHSIFFRFCISRKTAARFIRPGSPISLWLKL